MVPKGWRKVHMESVVAQQKHAIVDGPFGSNLKSEHYRSSGIPVIQSGFVTSGRFVAGEYVYVDNELFQQQIRSKVVPGDIVMAKIGARCGTCAILPEGHPEAIIAGNCLKITTNHQVCDPQFLLHMLKFLYSRTGLAEIKTETAQPAISLKNLKKLEVLLPPLPEQLKIAEILSTWDKAIALTERRIEAARQCKKGLMQRLLTGRVRFPEFVRLQEVQSTRLGTYPQDWAIRCLSDVTDIRFSNVDKKRKSSEQSVLLCNYMDVFDNDYIHNCMEFMKATATEAEIRKFSLKKDDVVITKDSETREEIAEPCVVVEDLENVVCGYHLAILRPKKSIISGLFLKDALRSSSVHHQFVRFANGITRFGLTLSAVHNALVPVPPVEEQRKIAAVLQACDREIELLIQKHDALQRQKKGLMQQLLTGRVRVKV